MVGLKQIIVYHLIAVLHHIQASMTEQGLQMKDNYADYGNKLAYLL